MLRVLIALKKRGKKKVPIFCHQDMEKDGNKNPSILSTSTLLHSFSERHEILGHFILFAVLYN